MHAIPVAFAVLAALQGVESGDDSGRDDRAAVEIVALTPEERDAAPFPTIDHLADGDVLDVTVVGGTEGGRGSVRQCVRTTVGLDNCTNQYPVQFDDRGRARFQYAVTDPGDCGPGGSCMLVVEVRDEPRQAYAGLVFGAAAAPPPTVEVAPTELVEPGDRVHVDVSGLAPGAVVHVGYCDPDCTVAERVVSDSAGRASTSVVVGPPCDGCGVAVITGAHHTMTPLTFAPAPQPGYDARRLSIGLAAAAALLAVGWRIIMSVDWRPPSEADTPDLDDVRL